jgi:hypothetical protein
MQHRIELSTLLLIAVKGKKIKSNLQPKVEGIRIKKLDRNVVKSKSVSVDAAGILMEELEECEF